MSESSTLTPAQDPNPCVTLLYDASLPSPCSSHTQCYHPSPSCLSTTLPTHLTSLPFVRTIPTRTQPSPTKTSHPPQSVPEHPSPPPIQPSASEPARGSPLPTEPPPYKPALYYHPPSIDCIPGSRSQANLSTHHPETSTNERGRPGALSRGCNLRSEESREGRMGACAQRGEWKDEGRQLGGLGGGEEEI